MPSDDHMALISHLYPNMYTQMIPHQGEATKQRRRRRKKSKGESSSDVGFKKRKLSEEQVKLLELNFGSEHKLESERKEQLASELGLDPRQVAVWFQNRRARWKNKKLEEEYAKLKSIYDNVILDKCRVESEVLKLKEELLEAEKEIQRLMSASEHAGNSPSSSYSVDVTSVYQQPFLGDQFGMEGFNDGLYMPVENNYAYNGEDQWINLYD